MRKMTVKQVEALGPGRHHIGGGLYLQVRGESRSWIYRYGVDGKTKEMGLGPCRDISLAKAREMVSAARQSRVSGKDPIEERRRVKSNNPNVVAFDDAAKQYFADHRQAWKSEVYARGWINSMEAHIFPHLGDMPVSEIKTSDVAAALRPIWMEIPTTARSLRERIEAVISWAAIRGAADPDAPNPARWKGALKHLLPDNKVKEKKHHAAIDWTDAPDLWAAIQPLTSASASALKFSMLTVGRTGEVLGATWEEISLSGALWSVPGRRMKAGKPHSVPLSKQAIALLESLPGEKSGHLFKGADGGELSNMAMAMALRGVAESKGWKITVHGIRSTLMDWVLESGCGFPQILADMALAHTVGDRVRAAYLRGRAIDRRREMMQSWCDFLEGAPVGKEDNVEAGERDH